ncbi:class IIb bacteriocin, lactobin A/cerein 7B family [Shewanella algae]|nr:class IIb bacteriocin, lactobin A/cerein 7B family [Shewanella algae]MBO2581834.1 class IIb bacteriocin, lactobin A/cerein 7B family [Shewanella algae]
MQELTKNEVQEVSGGIVVLAIGLVALFYSPEVH